jgi:hypothetical protein
MKNKRDADERPETKDDAVLLEDLVPRDDVRGGSGKIRFGQEPVRPSPSEDRSGLRKKRSRSE